MRRSICCSAENVCPISVSRLRTYDTRSRGIQLNDYDDRRETSQLWPDTAITTSITLLPRQHQPVGHKTLEKAGARARTDSQPGWATLSTAGVCRSLARHRVVQQPPSRAWPARGGREHRNNRCGDDVSRHSSTTNGGNGNRTPLHDPPAIIISRF